MSGTGIGAAVRRKEDLRFITGTGHYTDDFTRPGQALRLFCAFAARARQDQKNRRRRGGENAGRCRRCSPARSSPKTNSAI